MFVVIGVEAFGAGFGLVNFCCCCWFCGVDIVEAIIDVVVDFGGVVGMLNK